MEIRSSACSAVTYRKHWILETLAGYTAGTGIYICRIYLCTSPSLTLGQQSCFRTHLQRALGDEFALHGVVLHHGTVGTSLFHIQTGQMQFLWGKHNEGVSNKKLHPLRAS